MRPLIFCALLCFISFSGFSQTDFRKGYIVTTTGDTLGGLVDYRDGNGAFKSCDFKKSSDLPSTTYNPNDILGYGFSDYKVFEVKEFTIADQSLKTSFVEVLIKGAVNLYRFEESFLISKGGKKLEILTNPSIEEYVDGKLFSKSSNRHIATLNMQMGDCIELRETIQNAELSERNLTKLVEKYSTCKGIPSVVFKSKKPWTKITVGVTGGINISMLDVKPRSGFDYLSGPFDNSKSWIAGISLDVLSPRISERLSFHTDLLYTNSEYYQYSEYSTSSTVERDYVTIELQQLKIPFGIRYTFPERSFTPYFNVGVSSTFHLKSSSTWTREVESNQVVNTYDVGDLPLENSQFGIWGGFGMQRSLGKRSTAFVEVRFERTNGITKPDFPYRNMTSAISNVQIIVGVRTK